MTASLYLYQTNDLKLGFNAETASLDFLGFGDAIYGDTNFLAPSSAPRPLFVLRFRNTSGWERVISSLDLGAPFFETQHDGSLQIVFEKRNAFFNVRAEVSVKIAPNKPESEWRITVEHDSAGFLEWIELPRVVVPDNLKGNGGDATILWPAVEGVLIEDLKHREGNWLNYREIEYPNHGWCGYYPGAASMQFLAYSTRGKTLYFASHDASHATKEIEYSRDADGARLIQKVYPGAIGKGRYELLYPVVLSVLDGDWHAAAQRYRDWTKSGEFALPQPIRERADIPAWVHDSPIVVTYPVTGVGHHAGPTQPNEYFPFSDAMPVMERLGDALESRLLVVPMHWEGTAPWSPPYVWPPLGGEDGLRDFVAKLHAKKHLFGLYCSGVAWTNDSTTGAGGYDRHEEFERENLIRFMCKGPRDEYQSLICNGDDLRYGYDMCVETDFARDVIATESLKMASAAVDYIQLLGQNLGGASYQCYDEAHGHAAAPGPWQAVSMRRFLQNVRGKLDAAGHKNVLLGCEGAAAETYLEALPMNDLRFHMGLAYGRPVPAYAFVFHQYGCNFMGNQVESLVFLDQEKNPWNLAFRFAYSFVAGDLMTVILKDGGQIHWAWCAKWEVEGPEQAAHLAFLNHLNAWRRGAGEAFLFGGEMLTPNTFQGAQTTTLELRLGPQIEYSKVLSSKWRDAAGNEAQFFVNFSDETQRIEVVDWPQEAQIFEDPSGESSTRSAQNGVFALEIAPRRAVMLHATNETERPQINA